MEFMLLPAESGMDRDLGVLVATLEDGTREWLESLGEPGDAAIVWQPYLNGPSIGGVIMHMISCEWHWLSKFVHGEVVDPEDVAVKYDLTVQQDVPHWPKPPEKPFAWYREFMSRSRVKTIETISRHNQPEAQYPRGEETFSYRWIVAHLVEHDSYHGGQAVLLHEMWKKVG